MLSLEWVILLLHNIFAIAENGLKKGVNCAVHFGHI